MPPRRGEISLFSAFTGGLGGEGGDALLDPLAFALRTGNIGLAMLLRRSSST